MVIGSEHTLRGLEPDVGCLSQLNYNTDFTIAFLCLAFIYTHAAVRGSQQDTFVVIGQL